MGEGIHNRNKLLVSFLSWFMIKKREREADVESLSAWVETCLLLTGCCDFREIGIYNNASNFK